MLAMMLMKDMTQLMLSSLQTKQSADTLEAINSIKGELSHSRRISQAEEDVGALQQKVKQLEETAKILSNKIRGQRKMLKPETGRPP